MGTNHPKQYTLIEASQKKLPKNANDPKDNKYELLVLKYDANEDALVVEKNGRRAVDENTINIKRWRRLRKNRGKILWVM